MITEKERADAAKNTNSRLKAIELMCKDCVYDDHEAGSWRKQTERCTCEKTCPLWNFRPKSSSPGLLADSQATSDDRSPARGIEVYRRPRGKQGQFLKGEK